VACTQVPAYPRHGVWRNGPLGVRHAAQWADGWMPVDVALADVAASFKDFRRQVSDFGRDPDSVEITLVIMAEVTPDLLKYHHDCGVSRCNIGLGMQNWNKPDIVMPMIEQYGNIISEL
jgi:alkanesulfonate monooxygenase SsuD/methylene tetrahydromethanopterin reductase-like flavin-dependent oxidoreductase (luciferase family)